MDDDQCKAAILRQGNTKYIASMVQVITIADVQYQAGCTYKSTPVTVNRKLTYKTGYVIVVEQGLL